MTYKSKKHKRKIKKYTRRKMSGGSLTEYRDFLKKTETLSKTRLPNQEEVGKVDDATLKSKIYKALISLIKSGEHKIATYFNIDLSNPIDMSFLENNSKLIAVFNTPKGEKLKKDMSVVLSKSVDVLKPSLDKLKVILNDFIKEESELAPKIAEKVVLSLPVIGDVIGISGALMNSAQAATKAADSVSQATQVGTETIQNLKQYKEQIDDILEEGKKLTTDIGKNVMDTVQKNIDKSMPLPLPKSTMHSPISNSQKANMVGGQIQHSISEFLKY